MTEMTLEQIVNLILNSGTTVLVLAYFIWRDSKFMQKLDSTLEQIKSFIEEREKE